jgi:hypothetical protein
MQRNTNSPDGVRPQPVERFIDMVEALLPWRKIEQLKRAQWCGRSR